MCPCRIQRVISVPKGSIIPFNPPHSSSTSSSSSNPCLAFPLFVITSRSINLCFWLFISQDVHYPIPFCIKESNTEDMSLCCVAFIRICRNVIIPRSVQISHRIWMWILKMKFMKRKRKVMDSKLFILDSGGLGFVLLYLWNMKIH